ncbi:hypothetical protein P8452_22682 [Trifolium repens]|nr:hypothetical protein P8452_22682 [Trifolium repens]
MTNRKVRCETQNSNDVSTDDLTAIQLLMNLNIKKGGRSNNNNNSSSSSSNNNNNNNVVRRGRETRIPKKEVDQRLKNTKNSETDEPEKIKYRSLADIYAVTKPINPKN